MYPGDYEILRGVVNGAAFVSLQRCPKKVWTLLDEEKLKRIGVVHWHSAFLEDRMHDWDWKDGQFRFYGHSGEKGEIHDLLVEY